MGAVFIFSLNISLYFLSFFTCLEYTCHEYPSFQGPLLVPPFHGKRLSTVFQIYLCWWVEASHTSPQNRGGGGYRKMAHTHTQTLTHTGVPERTRHTQTHLRGRQALRGLLTWVSPQLWVGTQRTPIPSNGTPIHTLPSRCCALWRRDEQ